jgi:hypothetical protein
VAATATDCRILRVAGVESELELPFAGLHALCGPLLGEVEAVPEHQEEALRVALGLEAGPTPDRFLVGLGVLSVLAEVAGKRPVVLLVDDAQWLDEASCQVIGIVARRLLAESVLLLLAVREPCSLSLHQVTLTRRSANDSSRRRAATRSCCWSWPAA